jgi:hypothetical protein
MSTTRRKTIVLESNARPVRRTGNLTAICEPMRDPQDLTTLYASTACYGDSFYEENRHEKNTRFVSFEKELKGMSAL